MSIMSTAVFISMGAAHSLAVGTEVAGTVVVDTVVIGKAVARHTAVDIAAPRLVASASWSMQ